MNKIWQFDGERLSALAVRTSNDVRDLSIRRRDGAVLAVGNRGLLLRLTGETAVQQQVGTEALRGVCWHPDGHLGLAVGNGGTIAVISEGTAEVRPHLTPIALRRVAWHPDGGYALIAGNDGLLLRWSEGKISSAGWGMRHLRAIAFRPDGAGALVPGNGALYWFDGNGLDPVFEQQDVDFVSAAWNASSETALIAGYRQPDPSDPEREGILFHYQPASGAVAQSATHSAGPLIHVSWRPEPGEWWAADHPNRAGAGSTVYRVRSDRLEAVANLPGTKLASLAWQENGLRSILAASSRAMFFRV